MSESPMPYNFGGEPSRPIRNKHLQPAQPSPGKKIAWNKGIRYKQDKRKATPTMKRFGLHHMVPGESKRIEHQGNKKALTDTLRAIAVRENYAITVQVRGCEIIVHCVRSLNRVD
jgi:hypothetical protein